MEKIESYNRLIIGEDMLALAKDSDIEDVLCLGEASDVFHLEDGILSTPKEEYTINEFTDMYAEDEDGEYEFDDEYGVPRRYCQVGFHECEQHYVRLRSQHGINTSYYDITDADVIEVEVFRVRHIEQNYPSQCCTNFYKAVDTNGKAYYIVESCDFFADENDDVYELVTEEEFNKYEQ